MTSFVPPFSSTAGAIDALLDGICEELQLPRSRHEAADERYQALGAFLESASSPFAGRRPRIYPQGSMRLGTTVKPLVGPHDLDFVIELDLKPSTLEPVALLDALYGYLRSRGTYRDMTERK